MSRSLVLLAALFLASAPTIAWAQGNGQSASAAPDEVSLKNGGIVRGTVVSVDPGHEVVISIPGVRDARTIPWAEVANVERGKYSEKSAPPASGGYGAPPPPPPPTRGYAPPPMAAGGQGVVRLHIESPDPVQLFEHRTATVQTLYGGAYVSMSKTLCAAPCDQVIDARSGTFSIGGPDVPESSKFHLDDRQGAVTATVDPGSKGKRTAGIVLTAVGGAAILAGFVVMLSGAFPTDSFDSKGNEIPGSGNTALVPGAIILGAGAASIVGGIILIVTAKTHVDLALEPKTYGVAAAVKPRYWLGEF